jgi:hypothetical protein
MKSYYYIHTLSYYFGNNRSVNIYTAIDKLNTSVLSVETIDKKNLLIIYVIYDILNDDLKNFFDVFQSKQTSKLDIIVLYKYNTGGTIQSMFYTYNYLIDNNITSDYIGIWEDDNIFSDNYILDIVKEKLDQDNILVGPIWSNYDLEYKTIPPNYIRQVPLCKLYHIYQNDKSEDEIPYQDYKWVDGSGYLTTIDNLKKIKQKLNKFTLAPENERYTHCEHGINYGEVGFCVRLHINGFKFVGIPASKYYKQLEQNTIGDKNV